MAEQSRSRLMDLLKAANDVVYTNGALPRRIKLLIALALDAAHGAAGGVRSLPQSALEEGATREEIAEAVRVTHHLGGVGSVCTASLGLQELFA